MVSKDGYVKILDFGLAKLTEPVSQDESIAPTAIAAPTQPGTVMGTAGYMSPEQASGQPSTSLRPVLRSARSSTRWRRASAPSRGRPAPRRSSRSSGGARADRQAAPEGPGARPLDRRAPPRQGSRRALRLDARPRTGARERSATTCPRPPSPAASRPPSPRRRGAGVGLRRPFSRSSSGRRLGVAGGQSLGRKPAPAIRFQQLTFQRGQIISARFAPDGQTIVYSAAWDGRRSRSSRRGRTAPSRGPSSCPAPSALAVSSTGEIAVSLNRHFIVGFEGTGPSRGSRWPAARRERSSRTPRTPTGLPTARSSGGLLVGNRSRLEYPIGKVLYEAAGWVSLARVSPDGRMVAFPTT